MFNALDTIDASLIADAEEILDEYGLNLATAIRMMLKKVTKEKDITFLLPVPNRNNAPVLTEKQKEDSSMNDNNTMTKGRAISLFRYEGIDVTGVVTFSSKNKSTYTYWSNPEFSVLNTRWNLILNDWINHELHMFTLPANSLSASSLVARSDKPFQIDLQIMYGDKTYTDMRSKRSFAQYLVKTIRY